MNSSSTIASFDASQIALYLESHVESEIVSCLNLFHVNESPNFARIPTRLSCHDLHHDLLISTLHFSSKGESGLVHVMGIHDDIEPKHIGLDSFCPVLHQLLDIDPY
ncbi:hypothetical protein Tco_1067947 [Tanacetum coccineum]|uniref:Uncharacterized protein n=1 Tax=Tanacetum coccineum TaxID=301880 RepID=A0ABQ5HEU9_9ASTR